MYAKGVPEGYRPYDVFYATENRYNPKSKIQNCLVSVLQTLCPA